MEFPPWLGNLYEIPGLGRAATALISVVASAICGALIGLERERRDKPAGLRTLILIAMGSTIFTLTSLLLAGLKPMADPARLASQILPGIGFLGAGAIIQSRGTVVGLTTAATIWTVAAVGVVIGSGYVAGGTLFTTLILFTLTSLHWLERVAVEPCQFHRTTVDYRSESGKTRARLAEILDRYRVPEPFVRHRERNPELQVLEARICMRHREHRGVLREIAELPEVLALAVDWPTDDPARSSS